MTKNELIRAIAQRGKYTESQLERWSLAALRAEYETEPARQPAMPTPSEARAMRDAAFPTITAEPAPSAGSDPWQVMAAQIAPHLPTPDIDTFRQELAQARAEFDEAIAMKIAELSIPRRIIVEQRDRPTVDVGVQHKQFPALLRRATNPDPRYRHTWIYGAPGGGKTHVAEAVATALGLPFRFLAFSSQTTATKLSGFTDANGKVVSTVVREAAEQGGVLLFDEADKCSPAIQAELHSMLSQGRLGTPDGHVDCHESLIVFVAANTAGLGGQHGHETAQKADAAFRDRFGFMEWHYDEELERHLALATNPAAGPWIDWIHAVRRSIAQRPTEWRIMATPRSTYGCAAFALDPENTPEEIADAWLFRGCDLQTRTQVLAAHPLPRSATR